MGVLITPQLKSLTFELKIEGYYTLCYTGLPPAPRRLEDLWNVYLRVHIDGGNFLIGIAFLLLSWALTLKNYSFIRHVPEMMSYNTPLSASLTGGEGGALDPFTNTSK